MISPLLAYWFTNCRIIPLSLKCVEYSCAMKSHFRKFGNQSSGTRKSPILCLMTYPFLLGYLSRPCRICGELQSLQMSQQKLWFDMHKSGSKKWFPYHRTADVKPSGIFSDNEECNRDFSMLMSDERVKHIVTQADYYGCSGEKVKGLIFCSTLKLKRGIWSWKKQKRQSGLRKIN